MRLSSWRVSWTGLLYSRYRRSFPPEIFILPTPKQPDQRFRNRMRRLWPLSDLSAPSTY